MDSEAQENNVHEMLSEYFRLLFGDQYVSHQTEARIYSNGLRAMSSCTVKICLNINVQVDVEYTTHSYHEMLRTKLDPWFLKNFSFIEMNTKHISIIAEAISSASSGVELLEQIKNDLTKQRRLAYDNNFNFDLETVLDEDRKVR